MGRSVEGAITEAIIIVVMIAGVLWMLLGWNPIIAWLLAVNVVTPYMFWDDKQKARAGKWRVPEGVLLLLVFLGGSPGGLLGSQLLRHKTSKSSFRIQFWTVIVLQVALVAGLFYYLYHRQDEPPARKPDVVIENVSPRSIPVDIRY